MNQHYGQKTQVTGNAKIQPWHLPLCCAFFICPGYNHLGDLRIRIFFFGSLNGLHNCLSSTINDKENYTSPRLQLMTSTCSSVMTKPIRNGNNLVWRIIKNTTILVFNLQALRQQRSARSLKIDCKSLNSPRDSVNVSVFWWKYRECRKHFPKCFRDNGFCP